MNSTAYLEMIKTPEFEQMMPKYTDLIIIGLGSNDAGFNIETQYCQGVSIQQYEQNLASLIQFAHIYTKNIALLVPTPITVFDGRSAEQTEAYSISAKDVAAAHKCQIIDVRGRQSDNKLIVRDGLHLSSLGNQVVYEEALKVIGDLPLWRQHWSVWQ